MAERLFSNDFRQLIVRALRLGGGASIQCEPPFFDTALLRQIYTTFRASTKYPAYYYEHVPTYPGGGIGFVYASDTPWLNG